MDIAKALANAKFGDKFVTRNEEVVLFIKATPDNNECMFIDEYGFVFHVDDDGSHLSSTRIWDGYDIVSVYQEPVNQ